MASETPGLVSFNAGEWGPLMEARADLPNYKASCRTLSNFFPTAQGPAVKRSGTVRIGEIFNSESKCRLIEWVFNRDTAYVLELTAGRIRIWRKDGVLIATTPTNITTPWGEGDLALLQYEQLNDVMWFVHPDYNVRQLKRVSNTNWQFSEYFESREGPIGFRNDSGSNYLQVTGLDSGGIAPPTPITCTSVENVFTSKMVGQCIFFEAVIPLSYAAWKPSTGYSLGNYVYTERADIPGTYAVYICTQAGTSGTVAPDSVQVTATTIDGTCRWRFHHMGIAYARITGYTSPTQVTIIKEFEHADLGIEQYAIPSTFLTGSTKDAWRWGISAWGPSTGYPSAVKFYDGRLWLGGTATAPTTLWGSRVDVFRNFVPITTADDEAVEISFAVGRTARIGWIAATRGLAVGTSSGEFFVTGGENGITPTAFNVQADSFIGSDEQTPVTLDSSLFFVQRNGGTVREWVYDDNIQRHKGLDRTIIADHIVKGGVAGLRWQQEPNGLLWGIANDGTLVSLTYQRDESVLAWSRHDVNGIVESIAVVPSLDGDRDDVWLLVNRTIDGDTYRSIERLTAEVEDVPFDAAKVTTGAHTTVTGLAHLEGQTVGVYVSGADHPDRVVSGGSITLDGEALRSVVGLRFDATLEPQRIEAGATNGTSQGKKKRINNVVFYVRNTAQGLFYGSDEATLRPIQFRQADDFMDTPVPLYTGWTVKLPMEAGSHREGKLILRHSGPGPCTVMAIYPLINTTDER